MANHDSTLHEFDVFLSFRGSDTRLRLTDHLYAALERAGVRTFRDDEELERGESLNPQLEKAIKNSAASIIVFSENYASSQWCLDELVMILEHKRSSSGYHKVLAVFYHIDPCDVTYQRESFEKAFKHHVEKAFKHSDQKAKFEKLEKIEAWKIALGEAAEYSGIHITTTNGYETTYIYW